MDYPPFIYDETTDRMHLVHTRLDELTLCGVRWSGDGVSRADEEAYCGECMDVADADA